MRCTWGFCAVKKSGAEHKSVLQNQLLLLNAEAFKSFCYVVGGEGSEFVVTSIDTRRKKEAEEINFIRLLNKRNLKLLPSAVKDKKS
jgi:hypothetical protein